MKYLPSSLSHALKLFFALTLCHSAQASTVKFSGSLEGQLEFYPHEAGLEEQNDIFVSAAFRPEMSWRSESREHRIKLEGFGRVYDDNGSRSHADIRELSYRFSRDNWYLMGGINTVFWGVTESAHLVDIINQTDSLESITGEEKLGQLMIAGGVELDAVGNIDVYLMPYFRTRSQTTGPERFRFAVEQNGQLSAPDVDNNENYYESDAEEFQPEVAIRWYKSFDDFDLGVSYFNGTSREALPVTLDLGEALPELNNPDYVLSMGGYYQLLQQLGFEFQYLYDDWIFKLEAAHKLLDSGDFSQTTFGFEYTFSDMEPWGQDVGILVEYSWNDRKDIKVFRYSYDIDDSLSNPNSASYQPYNSLANFEPFGDGRTLEELTTIDGSYLSPMQNDLFVGARFALNDIASSEFLAGLIYDLDDGTSSLSFEGSTRIGDDVRLTANVYIFENVDDDNALKVIEHDDLIEFKAEWFF